MADLTGADIDRELYVARYAQNRLSDVEREAFEDYCVLHPEFARQVSVDRVLIEGLRSLEASTITRPAQSRWPRYAIAAGIAAVLMLAVGTILLRQPGESASRLFAMNADLPSVLAADPGNSVRLVRARGGYVPEVRVPSSASALKLILAPDAIEGAPPWQATLALEADGDWRDIGSVRSIHAGPGGGIELIADIRNVPAGMMRLTLRGAADKLEHFEIRLTRTAD